MHDELAESLNALLDAEDYIAARSMIDQALLDSEQYEVNERLSIQAELYGFLCDLGNESNSELDLGQSIAFFQANAEVLKTLIEESSYYYTLANAMSGLGKVLLKRLPEVPSPYATHAALHESISFYWLAYALAKHNHLKEQIAINLSNTLAFAGRYIEAIQFLDSVLLTSPSFPQALVSRADALSSLPHNTRGGLSASLLTQVFNNCNRALSTKSVIPTHATRMSMLMTQALSALRSYGFDLPDIETELAQTQAEYKGHSKQRRFSLDNFLTLSEHAVYCTCNAARWDDLQIGGSHIVLKDRMIPGLELLLNRTKAEFAWARSMYHFAIGKTPQWSMDSKFTELFEGEMIGSSTEMLRSSFRQCYGILDKLAMGLCELFDIKIKIVYFEQFWENKVVKEKIREEHNIHLNALHSIAYDLNTKSGQLRHFKHWRNALEHRLLVLVDGENAAYDPFNLLDREAVVKVDMEHFRESTLHLLQLTRAAIMSFTYCVRLKTMTNEEIEKGRTIRIDFRKQ